MIDFEVPEGAPAEFLLAMESLRTAAVREELVIEQIAAPGKLAGKRRRHGHRCCL